MKPQDEQPKKEEVKKEGSDNTTGSTGNSGSGSSTSGEASKKKRSRSHSKSRDRKRRSVILETLGFENYYKWKDTRDIHRSQEEVGLFINKLNTCFHLQS